MSWHHSTNAWICFKIVLVRPSLNFQLVSCSLELPQYLCCAEVRAKYRSATVTSFVRYVLVRYGTYATTDFRHIHVVEDGFDQSIRFQWIDEDSLRHRWWRQVAQDPPYWIEGIKPTITKSFGGGSFMFRRKTGTDITFLVHVNVIYHQGQKKAAESKTHIFTRVVLVVAFRSRYSS